MLPFWTFIFRGRLSACGTAHVNKRVFSKATAEPTSKPDHSGVQYQPPWKLWVTQVRLQQLLNLPKSATLHFLPVLTWVLMLPVYHG